MKIYNENIPDESLYRTQIPIEKIYVECYCSFKDIYVLLKNLAFSYFSYSGFGKYTGCFKKEVFFHLFGHQFLLVLFSVARWCDDERCMCVWRCSFVWQ